AAFNVSRESRTPRTNVRDVAPPWVYGYGSLLGRSPCPGSNRPRPVSSCLTTPVHRRRGISSGAGSVRSRRHSSQYWAKCRSQLVLTDRVGAGVGTLVTEAQ